MAKKCKCPPEGAPAWVVTYGDMMSLLLTFFSLLVALSEIKTEQKWRAIVDEVHRAFGRDSGGGKEATRFIDMPLTTQLAMLEVRQHRRKRIADVQEVDRGPRVIEIRDGQRLRSVIGVEETHADIASTIRLQDRQALTGGGRRLIDRQRIPFTR